MDHAFSIASLLDADERKLLIACDNGVGNESCNDNNPYIHNDVCIAHKNMANNSPCTTQSRSDLNVFLQNNDHFQLHPIFTTVSSNMDTSVPIKSMNYSFLHDKFDQDYFRESSHLSDKQDVDDKKEGLTIEDDQRTNYNDPDNYSSLNQYSWTVDEQCENHDKLNFNEHDSDHIHSAEYALCRNQLTNWLSQINKTRHGHKNSDITTGVNTTSDISTLGSR
ncbi:unnamed protein product [Heterobilharzia americana]|nr:unnamed protein product [Heterobilharzia americana]